MNGRWGSPFRVVVTGVGVVAPCGIGQDAFWDGLLQTPEPGLRRIEGWDPSPWYSSPKHSRRADRFEQFATAAAVEALAQSGAPAGDPVRQGVIVGTGIGGLNTIETEAIVRHERGARRVSPFMIPMVMGNAPAAAISMRHGFRGPCESVATACATGTHAIANAAALIRSGRCTAMVAGSTEAAMTETGVAGFANMTALSSTLTSRPFDVRRDGFVMAEGAAVLVLEEREAALARGATVLGEILGGASTADAHHITAPAPDGAGAVACIELALEDAGLGPADIAHINAHGTSTPLNDAAEAEALAKVFGLPGPPVTSIKGVVGHAMGAAGAIEAVAAILSMRHGLIPPTAGHDAVDPAMPAIDVVSGSPRPWQPGPVLSTSFGFGGHNGCLVLGPAA